MCIVPLMRIILKTHGSLKDSVSAPLASCVAEAAEAAAVTAGEKV